MIMPRQRKQYDVGLVRIITVCQKFTTTCLIFYPEKCTN